MFKICNILCVVMTYGFGMKAETCSCLLIKDVCVRIQWRRMIQKYSGMFRYILLKFRSFWRSEKYDQEFSGFHVWEDRQRHTDGHWELDQHIFFNILLTVHLSITLVNEPTLRTIVLFYNTFITVLYMFRATSCSSSKGKIVLIQHLV